MGRNIAPRVVVLDPTIGMRRGVRGIVHSLLFEFLHICLSPVSLPARTQTARPDLQSSSSLEEDERKNPEGGERNDASDDAYAASVEVTKKEMMRHTPGDGTDVRFGSTFIDSGT